MINGEKCRNFCIDVPFVLSPLYVGRLSWCKNEETFLTNWRDDLFPSNYLVKYLPQYMWTIKYIQSNSGFTTALNPMLSSFLTQPKSLGTVFSKSGAEMLSIGLTALAIFKLGLVVCLWKKHSELVILKKIIYYTQGMGCSFHLMQQRVRGWSIFWVKR